MNKICRRLLRGALPMLTVAGVVGIIATLFLLCPIAFGIVLFVIVLLTMAYNLGA